LGVTTACPWWLKAWGYWMKTKWLEKLVGAVGGGNTVAVANFHNGRKLLDMHPFPNISASCHGITITTSHQSPSLALTEAKPP